MFDIALRELGNVKSVFELAFANELSITETLQIGQVLAIPERLIPSTVSEGEANVKYIVDDAYMWYLKQFAAAAPVEINLDSVVKYTPQTPDETQQGSARQNLGINDEPVPNWSQQFLDEVGF